MKTVLETMIVVLVLIAASINSLEGSDELAKEQVVVLAVRAGDIGQIDPMISAVMQDRPVALHVFSALVRHPTGNATGELEPDLATKWEVSSDKLVWTFHLRRGVKWHWGYGELTSEDVVFSLNRVKNSKASGWSTNYTNIKEIKAIDKFTVQVSTFKPDSLFLNKVANYFGGFVVCKKAAEKTGDFDRPMSPTKEQIVGTGPFKFLEYKPKNRITLIRNDDYWEGKPIIEEIIIRYIPEVTAQELAILKGEISAMGAIEDDKWIENVRNKGMLVDMVGPLSLRALYFNSRVKPLEDKRIREAFACCFDQETVHRMGKGISRIAVSPVPSDMFGHVDAKWRKKHDVERGKKLLAEAGYPNGLTIKSYISVSPAYLDKMITVQSELRECGINVELIKLDHSAWRVKNKGDANTVIMFGDRLMLPTFWLRDRYHSDSRMGTPTAANNFSNYSNPEVDKYIELAETSFDKNVQLDALAKAQRLIVDDLPAVPVIEVFSVLLRVPWLDLGYKPVSDTSFHYQIGLKTRILKH